MKSEPRVIVLRHAETTWNLEGRIQGHTDIDPINPHVPDALVKAVYALEQPITVVLTTDLKRGRLPAIDLYQKLKNRFPQVGYEQTELLRERMLGKYEGERRDGFPALREMSVGEFCYRSKSIEGGESLQAVQQRAKEVKQLIETTNPAGVCVVVTHQCFGNHLFDELFPRVHPSEYLQLKPLSGYSLCFRSGNLASQQQFP